MAIIEENVKLFLDVYASRVETMLEANVISYYGPISNVFLKQFRNFFEISVDKRGDKKTDTLIIVLTTY
jgi:hypothetical protein